jgi:hypothetical protein
MVYPNPHSVVMVAIVVLRVFADNRMQMFEDYDLNMDWTPTLGLLEDADHEREIAGGIEVVAAGAAGGGIAPRSVRLAQEHVPCSRPA